MDGAINHVGASASAYVELASAFGYAVVFLDSNDVFLVRAADASRFAGANDVDELREHARRSRLPEFTGPVGVNWTAGIHTTARDLLAELPCRLTERAFRGQMRL